MTLADSFDLLGASISGGVVLGFLILISRWVTPR